MAVHDYGDDNEHPAHVPTDADLFNAVLTRLGCTTRVKEGQRMAVGLTLALHAIIDHAPR